LKSVNKLIKNKQTITLETAKLLSNAFGQSPQYWLNLDTNYRLRLQTSSKKEKNVAQRASIFNYMPIKEMIKKGWLKIHSTLEELEDEVKWFWGIDKIDFSFLDKPLLPNFRGRKPSLSIINITRSRGLRWHKNVRRHTVFLNTAREVY
jgi:HTH-type transcriptional regulator/antitoxin HigA